MSAFRELAIFCGDHPEIRAHRRIGELLLLVAAEIDKLTLDNAEMLKAINEASHELGVPQPDYPAPVTNASNILAVILVKHLEVQNNDYSGRCC